MIGTIYSTHHHRNWTTFISINWCTLVNNSFPITRGTPFHEIVFHVEMSVNN